MCKCGVCVPSVIPGTLPTLVSYVSPGAPRPTWGGSEFGPSVLGSQGNRPGAGLAHCPPFLFPVAELGGLSNITSPPLPPMGASCCEFYDSAWLFSSVVGIPAVMYLPPNCSGFLALFPCFLVWISFLNDERKAPPGPVYKMTAIPWLPLPGAIFFSFPLDFRFSNFSICSAEASPGYSLLDVGFTCKLHRARL